MSNSPYKTLGSLRSAVIRDSKEASSTNLITQVNRWLNEGYEQVILRKKREWLDKKFAIQFTSSTQAVAQVTKGSASVTFATGTTFPTLTSFEAVFYNTGYNEVYDVVSNSSTVVTIAKAYTGTSNTSAQGVFAQASALIDSSIRHVYQAYHNWSPSPMTYVGPQQFKEITERYGPNLDYGLYWTIFGQDDSTGSQRLMVYPYPAQPYTVYLDANVFVTPLSADTDEPIMPMQHRQILYHYALYKLFSFHRNDAKAGEYLTNFNTMLVKIDGESRPAQDYPQIQVRYNRGASRRRFFPSFDTRYRE
jgi:hypothetical protein